MPAWQKSEDSKQERSGGDSVDQKIFCCNAEDSSGKDFSPWQFPEMHQED